MTGLIGSALGAACMFVFNEFEQKGQFNVGSFKIYRFSSAPTVHSSDSGRHVHVIVDYRELPEVMG